MRVSNLTLNRQGLNLMKNDNKFLFKFLGFIMIEIKNVTPEKINKLLWTVAKVVFIAIILIKLPSYITAIKWW